MFKVGVIVDSFRSDLRDGIRKAKDAGAQGIQMYAVNGESAPENLNSSQRKELLDFIKSYGLEVSALCGDLGGHGFSFHEDNEWRIEKSKRIMELAKDLETDVVTTHIGVIPDDDTHPRWHILREVCEELAEFGDRIGAAFAIETGPEKAAVLKKFLDSLSARGVRVNFDPANLVMVVGDDPSAAAQLLSNYIVHTHAKDGIMLHKKDPEVIYGLKGDDFPQVAAFREMPLGKGDVDFPRYLGALKKIGYEGYLTIEREAGEDPEHDIRDAVQFLNRQISSMK
ncbi:MAG: sugar phosphate isomerase/epimerase family protein [Saccharofermentanales bacterium]